MTFESGQTVPKILSANPQDKVKLYWLTGLRLIYIAKCIQLLSACIFRIWLSRLVSCPFLQDYVPGIFAKQCVPLKTLTCDIIHYTMHIEQDIQFKVHMSLIQVMQYTATKFALVTSLTNCHKATSELHTLVASEKILSEHKIVQHI